MDRRQLSYLTEMGIDVWVPRGEGRDAPKDVPRLDRPVEPTGLTDSGVRSEETNLDWNELAEQVRSCTRCELHKSRMQTVFGVGDRCAQWLFIGEAPGADEDRQGEPFVGRAGQLLNNMLLALGLKREQVYIANILKCRPPGNRDPRPEEAQACRPYLERQVELLAPRVIVALGRIAAQNLLETEQPLSRMRGRRHSYRHTGIPVVVTYHPAYLLRSPREKRKAWQDLCLARGFVEVNSRKSS